MSGFTRKVRGEISGGRFSTLIVPYGSTGVPNTNPFPTSFYGANGKQDTISYTKTPNFRARIKRGEIIMNGVSMTKITRMTIGGSYSMVENVLGGFGTRTLSGDWPIVWQNTSWYSRPSYYNTLLSDAKKSTLVKAFSKVADADVQSLVSVGEFRESLNMIKRPFAKADSLLNKMISRKAKLMSRGISAARAGANAWLEYRLGWKPILYEIESYIKAHLNKTDDFQKPIRLVARSSANLQYSASSPYDGNLNNVLRCKMTGTHSWRAKISSGVIYTLQDSSSSASAMRRYGLRLSDVPSTLWELVPLSFVVDRFVDVGDWLKAITPKPGVQVLGSWTTVIQESKTQHNVLEVAFPSSKIPTNWIPGGGGGSFISEILNYDRTPSPDFPALPVINHTDLSLSQNLDHLSLLIAKMKRI